MHISSSGTIRMHDIDAALRLKFHHLDVADLVPGLATDMLVARYVLGWREWTPGYVGPQPAFVVNTQTQAIELCMDGQVLSVYPPDYPECTRSYRFSTDIDSAVVIYKLLPMMLQDWRLSPLRICQAALRWTQQEAMARE